MVVYPTTQHSITGYRVVVDPTTSNNRAQCGCVSNKIQQQGTVWCIQQQGTVWLCIQQHPTTGYNVVVYPTTSNNRAQCGYVSNNGVQHHKAEDEQAKVPKKGRHPLQGKDAQQQQHDLQWQGQQQYVVARSQDQELLRNQNCSNKDNGNHMGFKHWVGSKGETSIRFHRSAVLEFSFGIHGMHVVAGVEYLTDKILWQNSCTTTTKQWRQGTITSGSESNMECGGHHS